MKKLTFIALAFIFTSCQSEREKKVHHETDSIVSACNKVEGDLKKQLQESETNFVDSEYKASKKKHR